MSEQFSDQETEIKDIEAETQKEINEMLAQLEESDDGLIEMGSDVEVLEDDDFKGSPGDSSLEEIVGALPVEDTEIASEMTSKALSNKVIPMRSPVSSNVGSSEEGALSLKLSGKMKLDLEYVSAGHRVSVSFHEDAFVVQLDGGAEFRLPFKKAA